MAWDAVTAVGSVAGALILLIGTIAAIVQLKHLRVANQLECYLQLMERLNSREMVEARKYIETTDFTNPEVLREATTPDLDNRIRVVGTHYQTVARLLNQGVLEDELFAAHIVTATHIWNAIRPAIEVMRKRLKTPFLLDLQFLVYRFPHRDTVSQLVRRYPKEFIETAGLKEY
ncbi:MAG: DUF4760 domain-containing protein [Vulcanimicrobiaceae bacterium]